MTKRAIQQHRGLLLSDTGCNPRLAQQQWTLFLTVVTSSKDTEHVPSFRRFANRSQKHSQASLRNTEGIEWLGNRLAQRGSRDITFDNSVACCDGDSGLLILDLLDNMVVQDGQALCQSLHKPQVAPCSPCLHSQTGMQ